MNKIWLYLRLKQKNLKMKKTFILLFVAALGAGTMSSCNKSNKGKLSGEWTLSSMTETSSETYGNPSVTDTDITTLDGSTVTVESSSTAAGSATSTTNGIVNAANWTIEKDGTWSRTTDITLSGEETGYTFTQSLAETETGTWSFLGKNKTAELGKNERVVMSTLTSASNSSFTYTVTGGNPVTSSSSDSNTYAEGDNVATYLITESKKKDLTLTQVGASTYSNTDAGGTTTSSSSSLSTIVLTQD